MTKKSLSKKAKESKEKEVSSRTFNSSTSNTTIKIIGIGGGGSAVVSEISADFKRVGFLVANTDKRDLDEKAKKVKTFQFGEKLTGGFGTGMNSEMGKNAAESEKEKIKEHLRGQDMCIFISCLGGGTGSGAVPVFAKIAKDLGIITYGIFTLPFHFEGTRKMDIALESLVNVKNHLNAITILPNENIFKSIDKKTPLKEALMLINKNLSNCLKGLIETIYNPGLINIDFADLRTILKERGSLVYLNTIFFATDKGFDDIVKKMVSSPFYSYNISGASGLLFNITGGDNIGLKDVSFLSEGMAALAGKNAKIIFGISQNNQFENKAQLTLLAVGCQSADSCEQKTIIKKTKEVFKKKKKVITSNQKEVRTPPPTEGDSPQRKPVKIRKNGLQIKKEKEEVENESFDDRRWETPAFIRRNILNNDQLK